MITMANVLDCLSDLVLFSSTHAEMQRDQKGDPDFVLEEALDKARSILQKTGRGGLP